MLGPSLLRHNKKLEAVIFPPGDGGVLYTIALMGVYYFLFLEGVKVDITTIPKLRRKVIQIAFSGLIPYAVTMILICFFFRHLLPANIDNMFFLKFLALTHGLSFFPTLQPILAEFKLLNTHLGRLSMDVSMVHLLTGALMFTINQVIAQGYNDPLKGVHHLLSVFALWIFLGFFFRPAMVSIIGRTQEGRSVSSNCTVAVILLVLVVAFISNVIGATVFQGVLIMALLVPPGPPLGSALVKKIEPIGRVIFFPVYFIIAGSRVDLIKSGSWATWGVMGAVLLVSWLAKLLGIISSAVYFKIPVFDAVALAFACSSKGLIDLVILAVWHHAQV